MRDLHQYALHILQREHGRNGFENNFWRLAEALGFRVAPGDQALSVFGDPPLIMLNSYEYVRRRNSFAGMHEIVHLLFKRHGIEKDLLDQFDGDKHAFLPILESWCNQAAAQLLLPDHVVKEALECYGHTPEAVLRLHAHAGVGAGVALRRYVYACDNPAAAFVASRRGYVLDVARQYACVPFSRGVWLPDEFPLQGGCMPVSEEASVLTAPMDGGRVVGVVAW